MSSAAQTLARQSRREGASWFVRTREWLTNVDWMRVNKWITAILMIVLVAMLWSFARDVDWQAVWKAIRSYPATRIAEAFVVTALSYSVYACFDLFGRRAVGHRIPVPRVLGIATLSYAFNLTLGTIVGAAAIRFRLYQRAGLKTGEVARVIANSVLTNWLGYACVAGTLFVSGLIRLPEDWGTGVVGVRLIGAVMLVLVACYLGTVMIRGGEEVRIGKHTLSVPRTSFAWLQVLLGSINWMAIGGVLYALLNGSIPYPVVLGSILLAGVAGVISRVPGGVGVLEAVCVGVLGRYAGHNEVLAAVLCFRAVYYLVPMALAAISFAVMEAHHHTTKEERG